MPAKSALPIKRTVEIKEKPLTKPAVTPKATNDKNKVPNKNSKEIEKERAVTMTAEKVKRNVSDVVTGPKSEKKVEGTNVQNQ